MSERDEYGRPNTEEMDRKILFEEANKAESYRLGLEIVQALIVKECTVANINTWNAIKNNNAGGAEVVFFEAQLDILTKFQEIIDARVGEFNVKSREYRKQLDLLCEGNL